MGTVVLCVNHVKPYSANPPPSQAATVDVACSTFPHLEQHTHTLPHSHTCMHQCTHNICTKKKNSPTHTLNIRTKPHKRKQYIHTFKRIQQKENRHNHRNKHTKASPSEHHVQTQTDKNCISLYIAIRSRTYIIAALYKSHYHKTGPLSQHRPRLLSILWLLVCLCRGR